MTHEPSIDPDDVRLGALAHLKIPVWIFDVDALRIVWANAYALGFWDAGNADELSGRDMSIGLSRTAHMRLRQLQEDCNSGARSFSEYWTVYPHGVPQTAEAVMSPFSLPDGRTALLVHLLFVDSNAGSDTLHSAQALMHTASMISLYDADFELVYCNPAARSVLGDGRSAFARQLARPEDLVAVREGLERDGFCDVELEVLTAGGRVWHAMDIRLSPDAANGERSILVSAVDVTARHEAEATAFALAYCDPLTGLHNRTSLLSLLGERIDRGVEAAGFGLLFIDLDRFKLINDSLGHAIGDSVLVAFARCLDEVVGDEGIVSRLGGDEFVVIVDPAGDVSVVERMAQRIIERAGRSLPIGEHALRITPSIGVCLFPEHGRTGSELMQHADEAMYDAKAGKHGFAVFMPRMHEVITDRLDLENDLVTALERERFDVHFQPRIDTASGRIVGMEALARWAHPERGMVAPLEFIGVAEEAGLIVELGTQVMMEAMRRQKRWQDAGHAIHTSINTSARQFVGDQLYETVRRCLALTGAEPTMIELEITESLLLGDSDTIADMLRRLHELGVRLALDDFGTGYSNLAYLRKYPLDCLKIDRAFLVDEENAPLLEVMLGMGDALGLKVVAEGVETREQAEWLAAHGCEEMQGFWFGRPVSGDEATRLLETWSPRNLKSPTAKRRKRRGDERAA